MTDEELALEYVEGNNNAFDELLARTQSAVYSYIIYIVHNKEIADDIFQETFLKAIQKLKMNCYVKKGKFSSWLIRIAHNTIMDSYRRQKAKHLVDNEGDEQFIMQMSDMQNAETSREDLMTNAQILKDVQLLIDYLPETQRDIVKMRYYQNLSFKEIAELTGVSINTSLGRMRYALINLRRIAKENRLQLQLA